MLSKKTKHPTTFRVSWKSEVYKNLDGVDEKFDWLVPNDHKKAKCSFCIKSNPFSISRGGIADCKRHANSAHHQNLIKDRNKQRTLSDSLNVEFCDGDKVTKAETLQALKAVHYNMSFASGPGDAEMFPDSDIAAKYCQRETKTKYTIQVGIALR